MIKIQHWAGVSSGTIFKRRPVPFQKYEHKAANVLTSGASDLRDLALTECRSLWARSTTNFEPVLSSNEQSGPVLLCRTENCC